MSWISQLCAVYDANEEKIGKKGGNHRILRPLYHTTVQVQLEIAIDMNGELVPGRSRVLTEKGDQTTLIPCTEDSGARAGAKPAPHPLFDKLQYIAGDYDKYTAGSGKKASKAKEAAKQTSLFAEGQAESPNAGNGKEKTCFELYLEQLKDWCASPCAIPEIKAVYEYVRKGRLIEDMVREGLLFLDENGRLLEKWQQKGDKPPIFTACTGSPEGAFVRLRILGSDKSDFWNDKRLWESWKGYLSGKAGKEDICYATGKSCRPMRFAPKYIRKAGDGAKLISYNDKSNFTYRGRFADAEQAFCVGSEAADKSHAALSWLISRQGYWADKHNGDRVIVSWRRGGEETLSIADDSFDLALSMDDDLWDEIDEDTDGSDFARRLNRAIDGYANELQESDKAVIMGVDSATSGRMSIFYYQEMPEKQLVENIRNWHNTCSYRLAYKKITYHDTEKRVRFTGAPSTRDIIFTAYGQNVDDKLKKLAFERLLPCIVNGAPLPRDIMSCAVRRAANIYSGEDWERPRNRAVACALVRKYYNDIEKRKGNEEVWKMDVKTAPYDRSYIFGRILAYMDRIESYAQYKKGESRATNAARLEVAFAQHPAKMLGVLNKQLVPYFEQLGSLGRKWRGEMNELISSLKAEDISNKPLNELYIVGYADQWNEFMKNKKGADDETMDEETEE